MSFTSSDLESIETAIRALLTGAVEVAIGNRRYRKSELKQLQDTYDWMTGKVTQTSTTGLFRATFAATSDQDDNT